MGMGLMALGGSRICEGAVRVGGLGSWGEVPAAVVCVVAGGGVGSFD